MHSNLNCYWQLQNIYMYSYTYTLTSNKLISHVFIILFTNTVTLTQNACWSVPSYHNMIYLRAYKTILLLCVKRTKLIKFNCHLNCTPDLDINWYFHTLMICWPKFVTIYFKRWVTFAKATANACNAENGYWKSRVYALPSILPNCITCRKRVSNYKFLFLL